MAISEIYRHWELFPSGPPQHPHVPVLIAGGGTVGTLRQVAEYADASNFGAHAAVGSAFTEGAGPAADPVRVERHYRDAGGSHQPVPSPGRGRDAVLHRLRRSRRYRDAA